MASRELTLTEIEGLVGTHHDVVGFEYPANGLQPYYRWLVSSLHLLANASAGGLSVDQDNINDTTVRIAPGRARLDGVSLVYGGGVSDLSSFNNDIAYVWLHDVGGVATIGVGPDSVGWPAAAHIKLSEVTLSGGQIIKIEDRRFETMMSEGVTAGSIGAVHLADMIADSMVSYSLNIISQGDTSTPSVVAIALEDIQGNAINEVDHIRMRVCDNGGYVAGANATISAGNNTLAVEALVAGKDLVLQSHTDGIYNVQLTNTVAETVTVRIGPATLNPRRGDYAMSIDVTHT